MQVQMPSHEGDRYESNSQKARVISEAWIEQEAYCPACTSSTLDRLPPGEQVVDFRCPECREAFQAKSSSKPIHSRVMDAAYEPMINAVRRGAAPNLILLSYSREDWRVRDLILVPRHLFTASVVEKRSPIRPGRRRAGWVGCTIVIG